MFIDGVFQEHLSFPTLLTLLHVKPYDFCKVVDVLLKAMLDLPPALKTHLLRIRERIVESLAWLPGSSIYPLITATALDLAEVPSPVEATHSPLFKNATHPIPGLSLEKRSPSSAFKVVVSSSRTGHFSNSTAV